MSKASSTRTTFRNAAEKYVPKTGSATARAEQTAKETGRLNSLVDPAAFNTVRHSRPRHEPAGRKGELFRLAVGIPMPLELRFDTTMSMGDNVDRLLEVLPDVHDAALRFLQGYDLHMAFAAFGDVRDPIALCRSQFEWDGAKLVEQLTFMVPCRNGYDLPEDPDLGILGAAYLTKKRLAEYGLSSYDITLTDAPGRGRVDPDQVIRVYGPEAFMKMAENGYPIQRGDLPDTKEIVADLLKHAHAFVLLVNEDHMARDFWTALYGKERVLELPDIKLTPQVIGGIIGLTEGTLSPKDVNDYLRSANVAKDEANLITRSLAMIPIGAQTSRPNFGKLPKAGSIFAAKTELWPISDRKDGEEEDEGGGDKDKGDVKPKKAKWL